jgi:hypothetical protein
VQEEYLAPKIDRRFSLLWRAGQLPPPPPEMAGVSLQVVYQSAAAAAQKSAQGVAAVRIIEDLAPIAQISPEAAQRFADRIDPDGLLDVLMEARGAPARMFRSREDAQALADSRAEQQQQMMALQAAQAGAGALKDAASAGAMLQGDPGAAA